MAETTNKLQIVGDHMLKYIQPDSLKEHVDRAVCALRYHNFDTIAFRGMSGAFLGPSIAVRMNKQMILVRKPDDDSHSYRKVEGNQSALRYVIVDDFIASGNTKSTIINAVSKFAPEANFVGMLQVAYIRDHELAVTSKTAPYPLT